MTVDKKTELKSSVRLLRKKVETLGRYINSLEKRAPGFRSVSAEYLRMLKNVRSPGRLKQIVSLWFRSFLGYRDECMVLITGELIRSYHQKEHKSFIHTRADEDRCYKDYYQLSSCCTDGIDYEFCQLQAQKPPQSVEVIMDTIAVNSQQFSNRLHRVASELIRDFELPLKKLLTEIGASNITINVIHKGETINATVSGQAIEILRAMVDSCDQDTALSTSADEVADEIVGAIAVSNDISSKRKRNVRTIDDGDDEQIDSKDTRSDVEQVGEESVDAIKRRYGYGVDNETNRAESSAANIAAAESTFRRTRISDDETSSDVTGLQSRAAATIIAAALTEFANTTRNSAPAQSSSSSSATLRTGSADATATAAAGGGTSLQKSSFVHNNWGLPPARVDTLQIKVVDPFEISGTRHHRNHNSSDCNVVEMEMSWCTLMVSCSSLGMSALPVSVAADDILNLVWESEWLRGFDTVTPSSTSATSAPATAAATFIPLCPKAVVCMREATNEVVEIFTRGQTIELPKSWVKEACISTDSNHVNPNSNPFAAVGVVCYDSLKTQRLARAMIDYVNDALRREEKTRRAEEEEDVTVESLERIVNPAAVANVAVRERQKEKRRVMLAFLRPLMGCVCTYFEEDEKDDRGGQGRWLKMKNFPISVLSSLSSSSSSLAEEGEKEDVVTTSTSTTATATATVELFDYSLGVVSQLINNKGEDGDSSSSSPSSYGLSVDMTGSLLGAHAIVALVRRAACVNISCCGFMAGDLDSAAAMIRLLQSVGDMNTTATADTTNAAYSRNGNGGSGSDSGYLSVHKLILQHNRFLGYANTAGDGSSVPGSSSSSSSTPDDHVLTDDSNDSWRKFICAVLTKAPEIVELDVSHCAVSDREARVLMKGIVIALREREKLGWPPLQRLIVHGLMGAFPPVVTKFRESCPPVVNCDFGGLHRVFRLPSTV